MKISIKTKIILWFTIFFAIMTFSIIFYLNSISESVVLNEVETEIKETTEEVMENLVITNRGPVYVEELEDLEEDDDFEPFQYYVDNVAFVIYENNELLYGQLPSHFTEAPEIAIQSIEYIDLETEQFMIYDVSIDSTHVLRAIQNITTSENVLQGVVIQLLLITPLVILIAGSGGFFIMKSSFRPIEKLYQTAKLIKDEQDYSKRVPVSQTKDEIYHLSEMLNQMLTSIETTFEREKQFTSNVSHELRTPISVLKAQLEYFETKLSSSSRQEEMKEILKQLTYIEKLIDQILIFSKQESLDPKSFKKVNLYQTLQAVLETYEEAAKIKELKVTLEGDQSLQVHSDDMSLIRIFNNIVSNAIKYNNKQGLINVEVVKDNDTAKVTIYDTGIGLKKDELEKIFHPFYRVDEARTFDQMSLGIGLSMVERLLEQLQASITISSEYGKYTRVTITLPIKKEHN